MKRITLPILTILMLIGFSACVEPESTVSLNVEVKTNQGDPVAGASVIVDGDEVGKSDNHGKYSKELTLPVGKRKRVEIKKNSDTYYFAPFFESFVVADQAKQKVNVEATLYFVPKPKPEKSESETTTAEAPKPVEEVKEEPLPHPAPEKKPVADQEETAEVKPSETSKTPEAAKVTLTSIDEAVEEPNKVYPKPERKNKGETVFTVHVFSSGKPVKSSQVLVGRLDKGDLKIACMTNERGRCVVRFPDLPKEPVTFVAKKKGYETKSAVTRVSHQGKTRFNLKRGETIDIFAITKTYNFTKGLAGVEVSIGGKRVGSTDSFGRYSYVYAGKKDDLITITLKAKKYLPEAFETDFVVGGPMTLVRYFTPKTPPPVRLALLKLQPAGKVGEKNLKAFDGTVDGQIRRAARKHQFSSSSFQEYPLSLFNRAAKRADKTLADMMRSGWAKTDIKAIVDAVILPTLMVGPSPTLELSVIDSRGRVLAAAKEKMDSTSDSASIDRAVAVIAKKITRAFPFEGAVVGKKGALININIGKRHGRGVKSGDVLEVFGVQSGKYGQSQTHKKIATIKIKKVNDRESKCSVLKLEPRATVSRGDLVVLRPRKAPKVSSAQIRVVGNVSGTGSQAVGQANVYFNDKWIGATDSQGRLYVPASGSGSLKVIKHGYRNYEKSANLGAKRRLSVKLRREMAFIRLESKPSSATVRIDGKKIGKTPLASPIPVPSGFIKLEIDGIPGYKSFSRVLELDQGTLDMTGSNAIVLEKDIRAVAHKLLAAGKVTQALNKLGEIPREHTDYLLGRHEAGEILLTMRNEPAKAAAAFAIVTAEPAVRGYADKRFIGSHINEGIALFMTAEKLAKSQPEAAKAHYMKAIEVLEGVVPHLRFVPRDQYAQAVHNVDFHRALGRHKLWFQTKDPTMLSETVRAWRSYLDGSARTVPIEGDGKSYVENARVYYKQAMASRGKNTRAN